MKRVFAALLAVGFLVVYVATILVNESVQAIAPRDLVQLSDGEWRNVCGTILNVKAAGTATVITMQDAPVRITIFKDDGADVHVNDLREHDYLCAVGYMTRYKGEKTFILRQLGRMNE